MIYKMRSSKLKKGLILLGILVGMIVLLSLLFPRVNKVAIVAFIVALSIVLGLGVIIVSLLMKIKDRVKWSKRVRYLVGGCIILGMIVLLVPKKPKFTRFIDGARVFQSSSYYELILVKNTPKHSIERKKTMR